MTKVQIRSIEHHGFIRNKKQPPEYQIWSQVKQWCLNKKHQKYSQYGGRGIKIHPTWIKSFAAFFKSVGTRPSKKHRLFRNDLDKGYVPGNVRWADRFEHSRHTRKNRIVVFQGEEMALAEAAERAGIPPKRLQARLERGFTLSDAFFRPNEGGTRFFTWKGEEHNLATWARKLKVQYQTLYSRIFKMKWSLERAFTESV